MSVAFFVLRHSGQPACERRIACDRAIGGGRPGAGLHQRCRRADPDRRVEHQPLDLAGVLRSVSRHYRGAPRPAEQIEPGDVAALENRNRRPIRYPSLPCRRARSDGLASGGLAHFLRACRLAVAAQVKQVDVVAASGDVIHPGVPPSCRSNAVAPGRSRHAQEHRAVGPERWSCRPGVCCGHRSQYRGSDDGTIISSMTIFCD